MLFSLGVQVKRGAQRIHKGDRRDFIFFRGKRKCQGLSRTAGGYSIKPFDIATDGSGMCDGFLRIGKDNSSAMGG